MLTSEWVPKGNEIKLNVEQQGPILHPKSAKVKSYVSKNSRVELGHKLSCQREVDSTRLSLLVENAKCISRGESFSISPSKIPNLRKEMVAEISLGFLFS